MRVGGGVRSPDEMTANCSVGQSRAAKDLMSNGSDVRAPGRPLEDVTVQVTWVVRARSMREAVLVMRRSGVQVPHEALLPGQVERYPSCCGADSRSTRTMTLL